MLENFAALDSIRSVCPSSEQSSALAFWAATSSAYAAFSPPFFAALFSPQARVWVEA